MKLDNKPGWKFIEDNGTLYRGPARTVPIDVWSVKDKVWKPIKDTVPKDIEWGDIITEAEAIELIDA